MGNDTNGNDLNTLGFVSNLAKQGVIKLIIVVLISFNIYQFWANASIQNKLNDIYKDKVESEAKQTQFLMELLRGYEKTKTFVDTSYLHN